MTDFAPLNRRDTDAAIEDLHAAVKLRRENFDIHAAVRDANIKMAGLYGWPRIRSAIAPASAVPTEDRSTPAGNSCQPAGVAAGKVEGAR